MLSKQETAAIEALIGHYEKKQAACIEALRIVQRTHGWIRDEHLEDIAALLEMSVHELDAVATFYNLIYRRPVGRHVIHICDSVSCWLAGYERQLAHLQKRLGISLGQTTPDERFTLLPIPCLGACDHAPAMIIDEDLHEDLTDERIDRILEAYA